MKTTTISEKTAGADWVITVSGACKTFAGLEILAGPIDYRTTSARAMLSRVNQIERETGRIPYLSTVAALRAAALV